MQSPNVPAKPGIISDKPIAEAGFLQLWNHNQEAQQQQSNRSDLQYLLPQLEIYPK